MADYEAISKAVSNAVKREVDKQIKAAYERGYQKGYSEEYEARQSAVDIAYKRGLNDAWKCARKIGDASCTYLESMGFTNLEYRDKNPSWDCVMKYSVTEAIAKIKEYEEKQTEYKIKAEYDEETRSYSYMVDSSSEKPNRSARKIRKDSVRVPICSNCYMRLDERWNYCPHCGSKLVEGEEE